MTQKAQQTQQSQQTLQFIDAEEFNARISITRARRLIELALREGFDPGEDPARIGIEAAQGHLLLMPSVLGDWVGTKLATVAPDNPARDLPRIQAMYLLFSASTLTPRALIDGVALTNVRTPAVSAVAVDHLAPKAIEKMVLFGTGPQAFSHIAAMAEVRPIAEVVVLGRQADKAAAVVDYARELGLRARAGSVKDSAEVKDAQLIVCCTSADKPLFEGSLVRDDAVVVAMGSHEPSNRELDSQLMARAQVFVEERDTALREAGDVIQPVQEGELAATDLGELKDLVAGDYPVDASRPRVFKCVGMSWEDLAVASGVIDESLAPDAADPC